MILTDNPFIKTLDFYLYSSIHVAVAAILFILQTYVLLDIVIDIHYIVFIFSSTVFLYTLHNVLGLYIHENKVFRNKLVIINKMKNLLFSLIAISGIASVFCFFQLTFQEISTLAVFAFISIWYVLPIFGNKKRLSDYPIIKIFMVALVWAAIATIIPVNESNISNDIKLYIFIEKFMFIFALVIPFDMRDMHFDNSRNIKTIPIIYGKKKSVFLALLALTISVLIAIFLYSKSIYTPMTIYPIITGYIISAVVIYFSQNIKNDYYFTGLIDGLPILNFLLIILTTNIW